MWVRKNEKLPSDDNPMIKFRCPNCGQGYQVQPSYAGKKARCPICKAIITVPKQTNSADNRLHSILDPHLFDIPKDIFSKNQDQLVSLPTQPATLPVEQQEIPAETLEQIQKFRQEVGVEKPELESVRKLPWLIDIFLYPVSKPALTILGIAVGIPFLLHILVVFLGAIALVFPPMLVFFTLFAVIRYIIDFILSMYIYWYVCECIRDSAAGNIRAPEIIGITPGLWELGGQFLKIILCFAFFLSPPIVYFSYISKFDVIFWILCACSVFFFPMGLLSIVMFNSIEGLNPLRVIRCLLYTSPSPRD